MPKNSEACCRKLKELNVFGSFTHIESFGANLLPLDTDLLTLNNPRCVKVRTPAAEALLCCGCLYFLNMAIGFYGRVAFLNLATFFS